MSVVSNRELNLSDASLQADQVLLQLGLLLLDAADLILKLYVLNLLDLEISLELVLNSVGLKLEGLADLSRLVGEYILELFFLLTKHLDLTLGVEDVFLDLPGDGL